MTLALLIDMNLSPLWVEVLRLAGIQAVHWSTIGPANATDTTIMKWALDHQHVVFTHDFDFAALLALTHASGPSVVQLRGIRVLPSQVETVVLAAIRQSVDELLRGALVIIDAERLRIRSLPIG